MTSTTFDASHERTSLVGRRLELSWLRTRLALAGRGFAHMVLLEGDAGIGKTHLADALLSEARAAGMTVLRGRCYEHMDLAYLPLRDSLLTLGDAVGREPGREADVELLQRLGSAREDDPASWTDRDEREQTRQLLSFTRLLIEFARGTPTVLFVDDVHWADRSTVDLLRHLLFRFSDEEAPLLLLVTSRGDPRARAATGISQLRTEGRCATLLLHPLSELEATELARRLRTRVTRDEARQLAVAAAGNPLLLTALSVDIEGQTPLGDGRGHPLLDAISMRIGALGEPAQTAVRAAAFLVPFCTRELLEHVAELDPATLAEAIGEAVAEGILREERTALTFTHPLYARIVYDATPSPTRRELHRRIAGVLLERRLAGEPVAARSIAHHLIATGEGADRELLAEYARRAGDEAFGLAAWHEAARYYEAALDAIGPDDDALTLATLHRQAGVCHRFDLQLARAIEHFDQAIALQERRGDVDAVAALHLWRIRCAIGSQELLSVVVRREPLESLVEDLEDRNPALAADALVELSQSHWVEWHIGQAEDLARRAMDLANRTGNHDAFARATMTLSVPQWADYRLEESLRTLDEGVAHARMSSDESALAGGPLFRAPLVLTWLGMLDDAETRALECCSVAEQINYPLEKGLPLAALAQIAVARGHYDRAEQHAHEALLIQRLSGYHWAAGLFVPAAVSALVARGRYDAARDALDGWSEVAIPYEATTIALLARYIDVFERDLTVDDPRPLPTLPPRPTLGSDTWAVAMLGIARRSHVPIDARRVHDVLSEMERRGGLLANGLVAVIPRLLGVTADLLGDEEEAAETLERAIRVAEHLGAEPEAARARVDLATIHLRLAARDAALGLLGSAIETFERLGMAPELEQAERLGGMHPTGGGGRPHAGAGSAGSLPVANAVILFTDVVDSTRLTEELGKFAYRERARGLEMLVTSAIAAHGGSVVSGISLGDGFIGLFRSVDHALAAARRCATEAPSTGLHLHLAVHTGEIIVDGSRIFGGPVNLAARICAMTGPDEILVSAQVREAAALSGDVAFVDRGEHTLKGLEQPQRVYACVQPDAEQLPLG